MAQTLKRDLESLEVEGRKIRVWLDDSDIPIGGSIPKHIDDGMQNSRRFGILMTPAYFSSSSGWTDAEWHAAIFADPDNRTGALLTILAEDCDVPPLLRQFRHIDIRRNRYSKGLSQIAKSLSAPKARRTLPPAAQIESAEPEHVEELLYSNLFAIRELPRDLFTAKLGPGSFVRGGRPLTGLQIENRIRLTSASGQVPVFSLHRDELRLFVDPGKSDSPFRTYIATDSVRRVSLDEPLTSTHRNAIVELLNTCIQRHLIDAGLRQDPTRPDRYFYPPVSEARENRVTWTPSKRSATRLAASPYSDKDTGEVLFWRHHAAHIRVIQLGPDYALHISPTYVLTEDGFKIIGGSRVGKIISHWTAPERNFQIFYNVLFWRWSLGSKADVIQMGGKAFRIEPLPIQFKTHRGIANDHRDFRRDLENVTVAEAVEAALDVTVALGEPEPLESIDDV